MTQINKYQAVLFHPQGDHVTDFRHMETDHNDIGLQIEEVWDRINDMGSRWIFYPICFVGTSKTIVSGPDGLEFLFGKRITTVQKFFEKQWNQSNIDRRTKRQVKNLTNK